MPITFLLFSIGRQLEVSHTFKYFHIIVPRVRREFVHSFLVGCGVMFPEQKNRLVGSSSRPRQRSQIR